MNLIRSESDLKLKNDLYKIVNGEYDNHLTPEEVQFAIKLSFLFNHTTIDNDDVIFKYDSNIFKIRGIPDGFLNHRGLLSLHVPTVEFIISTISNEEVFKNSLKNFLRDAKIKKIID